MATIYKTTKTWVRPSADVEFHANGATNEAYAGRPIMEIVQAIEASDKRLGTLFVSSADGLTLAKSNFWTSKEDCDAFIATIQAQLDADDAITAGYYSANGIVTTEVNETVDVASLTEDEQGCLKYIPE